MEIQATKAYLKANKITYEQLSERSGIPLNTLKNIFSGRTPNPRIDTMQAIEAALGLSPNLIDANEQSKLETLSQKEEELLFLFRSLNSAMQDYILQVIKAIPKNA